MTKAQKNATPSLLRQAWLEAATAALRSRFASAGYSVPDALRVSCGFPKGSHGRAKAIGQCWATEASSDSHNEIFISPELGDAVRIFGVIAHELAHAAVGVDKGHKRPFKQCAVAVGLCGKMTATDETPEFQAWASGEIARIGAYPGGTLISIGRKKQTTRLLKCVCPDCDYTARVTRKWVESAGAPICPADEISMKCDEVDDEDGED